MDTQKKSNGIILIVDDDNSSRTLIKKMLAKENYTLLEAKNGKSAIKIAQKEHPHLILLDVIMPGMDGYETCKALKQNKQTQDIPVVFVTGQHNIKDQVKGLNSGALDYIVKPFNTRILSQKVKNFIALRKGEIEHSFLRLIEDELIRSETRERSLRMVMPNILYQISPEGIIDGRITEINSSVDILGYTPEELIGKPLCKIIHPDDVKKIAKSFVIPKYKNKEKKTPLLPADERRTDQRRTINLETRLIAKDGQILNVMINAVGRYKRDKQGGLKFIGTYGVITDITDLKQIEKKLEEERNLLQTIINTIPDQIYIKNTKGQFVIANRACLKKYGMKKPEDIIGKTDFDFYPKSLAKSCFDDEQKIFHTGKPILNKEHIIKPKNSPEYCFIISKIPYKDSNGNIGGLVGINRDITDLREAEDEAIQKWELLNIIINTIPDIISVKNTNNQFIAVNRACLKFMGEKKSENVIGKTDFDFWPGSLSESFYKEEQKIFQSGRPMINQEYKYADNNGKKGYALSSKLPLKDSNNNIIGLVAISRDVTKIKETEEELKKKWELLQNIINIVPDSIYVKDTKSRFIIGNQACLKNMGVKKINAIIGKTDFDFSPKPLVQSWFDDEQKIFRTGKPIINNDYEYTTEDGKKEYSLISKIPYKDSNGKIIGLVGIGHDITEHQKEHERLLKAQKHAAEQEKLGLVGQIAGKMAHDFNNILAIIKGNAQMELLNDNLNDEIEKTLEIIVTASDKGKNLTKNLVAFAKDQEPKLSYFKLNDKISLVLTLLQNDMESIEIIRDYDPKLDNLLADTGMLEHALVNLIQNSIHAMSLTENPRLILKTYSKNKNICFEIIDNGCGIPEEYRNKIFHPSVTLKGSHDSSGAYKNNIKGTGYGLSNIKKYIEKHKGSISLKSKINQGTTFTISLPIFKEKLSKEEIKSIKIKQPLTATGKRVLLVEDEIALSHMEYTMLTKHLKHDVDVVSEGKIAIDYFNKNVYDVISLDYMLPDIDGMEVYEKIRKINKTIPIIFVSGNLQFLESTHKMKENDKYLDYISKPFDNTEYLDRINEWLIKTVDNKS